MAKRKSKAAPGAKNRAGTGLGRNDAGRKHPLSRILPAGGELRQPCRYRRSPFLGNSMASIEICPRAWSGIRCSTEEPRGSLRQHQALVLKINTVKLELSQCFLLYPSLQGTCHLPECLSTKTLHWRIPCRVVESGSLGTELPLLAHVWEGAFRTLVFPPVTSPSNNGHPS